MFTIHSASSPRAASIGRALGRIPSGLFILTAGQRPDAHAMLVSWVQQVGFEPPAISMALAKDRPMLGALRGLGTFALSVLGRSQSALFKRYARPIAGGADPFEGVAVRTSPGGQIVFSDAVAWLECKVLRICDFDGDHDVLIAEVIAGELGTDEPAFTHLRGNGLHY